MNAYKPILILIVSLILIPQSCFADFLGDYCVDDTLRIYAQFNDTSGSFGTATSTTYRVYEEGTGTALSNGSLTALDGTSAVGMYTASVTLTSASGYENGKSYVVRVTGTIDSQTPASSHNFRVRCQLTTAAIADAVWDEDIVAAHNTADTAGELLDGDATGGVRVVSLADDSITAAVMAASSIGSSEAPNLNATISSRSTLTQTQVTGGAYALSTDSNGRIRIVDGTGVGEIDTLSGAIVNVDLVDLTTSVTNNVGITPTAVDSIWDEVITGHVTADSFGLVFDNQIDGLRSYGDSNWTTATGFSTHSAADVRVEMDSNSVDLNAILADTDAGGAGPWTTATGFSTHTALDTADAVWDEDIVAAHNTSNTAGALLDTPSDWITATGFSTHSAADVWTSGTRTLTSYSDGSGFTSIPWNSAWDVEVESESTDALNVYDPPTNTEMIARTLVAASYFDPTVDTVANVTTVATLTGHTVQTSDHTANISAILLDTGTTLDTYLTDIRGVTFSGATDSLEAIRDRGDVAWLTATGFSTDSAADIADAVWDEPKSGHTGSATFGDLATDLDSVNAAVSGIQSDLDNGTDGLGAIKSDTLSILIDTSDMQPKLGVPVIDISSDIAAIEAQTDDIGSSGSGLTSIPWNSAWDTEVESEVTDSLIAYGSPTFTNVQNECSTSIEIWSEDLSTYTTEDQAGQILGTSQ